MSEIIDLRDSSLLSNDMADIENYLFSPSFDPIGVFDNIREEMWQLNDFCLLCLETTSNHIRNMEITVKRLRSGEERFEDPEIGDVSEESAMGMEDYEIPLWKDTEQTIVRAMCLVLLSAFLEKSLKDLANYFSPLEKSIYQRQKRIGEIESLIRYLKETCLITFEEPKNSKEVREKCRNIRNNFAHGRWDYVKKQISTFSLSEAFGSVTKLLESIEQAVKQRSNQ